MKETKETVCSDLGRKHLKQSCFFSAGFPFVKIQGKLQGFLQRNLPNNNFKK